MILRLASLWASLLAALALAACGAERTPVTFHPEGEPRLLSDWGALTLENGRLRPADGFVAYDLASPLFTDYAHKMRAVYIPEGQSARYHADEVFDFPVGSIITKTFYYPVRSGDAPEAVLKTDDPAFVDGQGVDLKEVRLIETRVLVRRAEGWAALPYVWNEDETEAVLKRAGAIVPLELVSADGAREAFAYVTPTTAQCASCHVTDHTAGALMPIGPKARHLNVDFPYRAKPQNQIDHWIEAGLLTGAPPSDRPQGAVWTDPAFTLEARARTYLDINCSHCHSPAGPADTSGLDLTPDAPHGPSLGICKRPIAAAQGTGGRALSIVPGHPELSIFTYRLESTDPGEMMPELGRSLAHNEGAALIEQWIAAMEGACGPA